MFFKKNVYIYIILLVFICISMIQVATAKDTFYSELSIGIGMANISYTENAKYLQAEEGVTADPAVSGSADVLAADFTLSLWSSDKKSWYTRFIVPLVYSNTGSYYGVGTGVEYFISSQATKIKFESNDARLKIIPSFRFSLGAEVGVGYLTYLTTTKQKSDVMFNLGVLGNGYYNFNSIWGMKLNATVTRGTGVATTCFGMKIFLGATYFFDT